MDKQNWVKIGLGAAGVGLSLYVLYKLISGGSKGAPALTTTHKEDSPSAKDPLLSVIDQRGSQEERDRVAEGIAVKYITDNQLTEIVKLHPGQRRYKPDVFEKLHKFIYFFSNAQLYESKVNFQAERVDLLNTNFEAYMEKIVSQIEIEGQKFQDSIGQVFKLLNESQTTFCQMYSEEDFNLQVLERELQATFNSPYKCQRGFTIDRAREMFMNVFQAAEEKLSDPVLLQYITAEVDFVLYLDRLVSDYALLHYQIQGEEFRATITKYDLLNDPAVQEVLKSVKDSIFKSIQVKTQQLAEEEAAEQQRILSERALQEQIKAQALLNATESESRVPEDQNQDEGH